MPDKRTPLVTEGYYHIFNRGVGKRPTFLSSSDYQQAMSSFPYYRFKDLPFKFSRYKRLSLENKGLLLRQLQEKGNELVDIISFVLMPNHFHFLLKQNIENGISIFVGRFVNSYTKYFNTVHNNIGPIFQGVFKDVAVETDEQLLHVSRYIHLNPLVSMVVDKSNFLSYPYSSMRDYIEGSSWMIKVKEILAHFPSINSYKEFVLNQAGYGERLEIIKHHLVDD